MGAGDANIEFVIAQGILGFLLRNMRKRKQRLQQAAADIHGFIFLGDYRAVEKLISFAIGCSYSSPSILIFPPLSLLATFNRLSLEKARLAANCSQILLALRLLLLLLLIIFFSCLISRREDRGGV